MKVVSPLLKRVVYPALASSGVFRRTSAQGLAIVTYHGVMPSGYRPVDAAFDGNLVSTDNLRRQLRMLKANYSVISPEDVLAWRRGDAQIPPRAVLLTCDDGLLNCLTEMVPVLNEESVKCLFFVTGASALDTRATLWYEDLFLILLRARARAFKISHEGIDLSGKLSSIEQRRSIWWIAVKRLSQLDSTRRASFVGALHAQLESPPEIDLANEVSCRRLGLLTGRELRELAAAGMTIGAHSMSHPMLSQMSPDLAYKEIYDSRTELEKILGQKVWAFAYPFGDTESVTPEILALSQKAGFEVAFLNHGGGLGAALPAFALPRVHVTSEINLPELEAHLSGFHLRMQRRIGRNPQAVDSMPASF
jgi:peptidoglycan/xylan/chitin deacetylase (PgdA/CDA1 family)